MEPLIRYGMGGTRLLRKRRSDFSDGPDLAADLSLNAVLRRRPTADPVHQAGRRRDRQAFAQIKGKDRSRIHPDAAETVSYQAAGTTRQPVRPG